VVFQQTTRTPENTVGLRLLKYWGPCSQEWQAETRTERGEEVAGVVAAVGVEEEAGVVVAETLPHWI
jgi:hypothetical protein